MNERHPNEPTTQQNLTNKLARETITFSEVMEIADILEHDIVFKKETDHNPNRTTKNKPCTAQRCRLFFGGSILIVIRFFFDYNIMF